jgi:hypothetical protein
MSHVAIVLLALALSLTETGVARAADWTVKTVARADGPGVGCMLESSRQSLPDGYQKTTAYISVTPRSVTVISVSVLDGGFKDIGLVVDQRELIPMDRLEGDKTAIFDSQYDRVVEQFKVGLQARVQLRFWPTWPATGAHSTTFSLIGFTKAYDQLSGCR